MSVMTLGMNYHSSPSHLREGILLQQSRFTTMVNHLIANKCATEAVVVSTCNRTELYVDSDDPKRLMDWLLQAFALKQSALLRHGYFYTNEDSAKHLMRVASGLDSMVLGEVEILGQLKNAYSLATASGTVGKYLSRLFQSSFAVAKQVRTQTAISVNPVSLAYTAVRLCRQFYPDLTQVKVLIVGAGETAELLMRHFHAQGVESLTVCNRTLEKAKKLVNTIEGKAQPLEVLKKIIDEYEVVVCAASSAKPLITRSTFAQSTNLRPKLFVDLGFPRNVDPAVGAMMGISLFSLSHLEDLIRDNRKSRFQAAKQAEIIVRQKAKSFMEWVKTQQAIEIICCMREKHKSDRDRLVEQALKELAQGGDPADLIKELGFGLTNKFLHQPTLFFKEATLNGDEQSLQLARKLFKLPHL